MAIWNHPIVGGNGTPAMASHRWRCMVASVPSSQLLSYADRDLPEVQFCCWSHPRSAPLCSELVQGRGARSRSSSSFDLIKRSSPARHSVERGGDGESRRVIQEARGRILREPVPAMCEVEGVWPDALWICWNRGYSSANSGGDGQAANCVGFSHLIFSVAIGQWGPDASCSTTAQA
jgi:hypothetical protein